MKWVSVKERLPEFSEYPWVDVIVAQRFSDTGEYYVGEAQYSSTRNSDGELHPEYVGSTLEFDFVEWLGGDDWSPIGDTVTHWMYLPDPPEEVA